MIVQRFRALGWFAGLATAVLLLYMISLQVAATRGRLDAVDRQILTAKADMRRLQTEFGTRASMRQLERWNGEALALTTPKASQFLRGEVQLAALDASLLDPKVPARPGVTMAAAPAPAAPRDDAPPATVPAAGAKLTYATYTAPAEPAPVRRAAVVETAVATAPARPPATAKPRRPAEATHARQAARADTAPASRDKARPAAAKPPLLKGTTLAGLARTADRERRR